ncbi:MAG: nucleotidyltransferase domain-containing protein, partial [Nitrospinae bacterium]|nr:nucleotidyltransferase domain-containing protein [Nitrospinota bacterium]
MSILIKKIQPWLDEISQQDNCQGIFIFGSAARGDVWEKSDVDLVWMELCEHEAVEVEGVQGITESGKVCSTWARLIQKVFETDPLTCNKCGGEMRIIAFISTQSEIRKILKHIDDETIRPPPLTR